jgi:hypothetical protein
MKKKYFASSLLKYYFILLLLIALSIHANGQSYSQIIFDKQQSQNFGSYNLITLHHLLYSFEDKHIRDTLFKENNFLKKTAGFGYRMAKLYFLDAQLDGFIALSQHEVFGHGARFREFGYEENSYNLNLYPPFGDGHGFARYGNLKKGFKYPTSQEYSAINIGGVDGEMLLANNLASQILLDDTLHYRQSLLYLIAQNNEICYLWFTRYSKPENIKPGNDMVNYINGINYLYSHSIDKVYDLKELSNQSLISFANPLQIYAAFSILYTYGIKGKKQNKKIPMIKFGEVRYLPALNYSLTPFGSQYHFINYVRYKRMLFSGDFNLGENTFNNFYGLSLKCYNLIDKKRITINFHLDAWNQPELELESYSRPLKANKIGEAFKVDVMLRPYIQQNKLGLFLQIGYKSKGYISGETLAESFILRYGLSIHL